MLTGNAATVYAQSSIQDSTALCSDSLIHYTDKQDKNCLECLINASRKDSMIVLNNILLEEQSSELQLLRNNVQTLKRRKKNAFYIGAGVGIFVTTVIALAVGLSK